MNRKVIVGAVVFALLALSVPGEAQRRMSASARAERANRALARWLDQDVAFIITDEQASAHHAKITTDGQQYWIEDLDSTNGTYIDGIRIEAPTPLHLDSLIKIGSTIIKFECLPDGAA